MNKLTVFPHKNYKAMYETACKALSAAVEEAINVKTENKRLRAELKVREGEILTLKDLIERQGVELKKKDGMIAAARSCLAQK